MKRTLIIGILLVVWTAAVAQTELSPKMAAFKEYCIRATLAAAECKVDVLEDCISNWTPPKYDANGNEIKDEIFVYKNEKIVYNPLGDFNKLDTTQEASLVGHFKFLPAEVDNWIVNKCEPVELAEACLVRPIGGNCEYVVRALKPNGKATYSSRGADKLEIFVVAESGGKVNLSVHVAEEDIFGEIVKETDLKDVVDGGREYSQLVWKMDYYGTIKITVKNTTDKEISFILVKN